MFPFIISHIVKHLLIFLFMLLQCSSQHILSTWPCLGPYFALFPYLSSSSFLWFWLLHFLILYCLSPFPSILSWNSHQPWSLDHGGLPSNLLWASGGQHRHPSACKEVKDAPIIKFKPLMWFFRPCSEMLFLIYSRRTNL